MKTIACPDCGVDVIADDNRVYLDTPAIAWDGGRAQWTLMPLWGRLIATAGDADAEGRAHTLHDHQPTDGPMS